MKASLLALNAAHLQRDDDGIIFKTTLQRRQAGQVWQTRIQYMNTTFVTWIHVSLIWTTRARTHVCDIHMYIYMIHNVRRGRERRGGSGGRGPFEDHMGPVGGWTGPI